MENSRLTFRELAEMTDLSVSAVHKRIKKLEDDNIISAYIARPNIIALKCLWVAVFGTSKVKLMDEVSKATQAILEIDKTAKIVIASGDPSIKQKALTSDAICFMEKPFDLVQLSQHINLFKKVYFQCM